MNVPPRDRTVLLGIFKDRQRLAAGDWGGGGLSRLELGAHRIRIHDAQAGLVAVNLGDWLGHSPSPVESVQYHRVCKRLEAAGLIERHQLGGGERTTHLSLTRAGETKARQLAGEPEAPP